MYEIIMYIYILIFSKYDGKNDDIKIYVLKSQKMMK